MRRQRLERTRGWLAAGFLVTLGGFVGTVLARLWQPGPLVIVWACLCAACLIAFAASLGR